jgi:hypothetical protein
MLVSLLPEMFETWVGHAIPVELLRTGIEGSFPWGEEPRVVGLLH